MFVKPFAAYGVVLLAGAAAISLALSGPALAASEGEAVPATPAQDGSHQPPEAAPTWYQEATVGTPEQSLWRAPPGETQQSEAAEPPQPALDKPMILLNGQFTRSKTSSFPHP